ncbi:MAG: hypothetical protein KGI58_03985 [Patescibacteria group bacterium]|nr:hypothetical protein [Patescibacteria group bacterium]
MFTQRSKILGATLLGVVVVGALSYGQYQNTKEIANIKASPVVVTKTVVVTPTVEPTATPAASLKFVPRASSASASKVVK